ncbi:Putative flagellar basal body P-ring formation protein FlgA [Candidatus Bealeia paramacronuclearis]|uniref:Flagellar basal body P-ring formation protein FlgA n=1 Tax=Candidatus Bealeia paramacronuclearis TaxID=1921001 RepID=A0ABZ2C4Z5_9PROT|nr:putative flagellar basal body P-ring formation protein FlgA [Candidatus Bealeia paramacronuclearis]
MHIFGLSVYLVLSLTFFVSPSLQATHTKEECEKICSHEACQKELVDSCKEGHGEKCNNHLYLDNCNQCKSLTPDLVKGCWEIYRSNR